MKSIQIDAERSYEVIFDDSWRYQLTELLAGRTRAAIIVSENMKENVKVNFEGDCEVFLFAIKDGEEGKSVESLAQVWNWLGAAGFTRSDLIVGLGGGAVTDFAGYAAASWLRGIDWVAIPTTVAGMVDAAIGGKTAVNSDYGKNLIGAFHSPTSVIIDLSWLSTLSDRDFAAGLVEVIKCGFISDGEILTLLADKTLTDIRNDANLTQDLIFRAIKVKADVVSSDFKESFHREILNYGHTLGHAVEIDAKYSLRHGECVAIGMAFMAHLQFSLGLIKEEVRDLHLSILGNLKLPLTYDRQAWPRILGHMYLDKKSRGKSIRLVTITDIGKTSRLESPDEASLLAAYEKVSS